MKRWIVREGDGATVAAIVLRAAPGDARAIDEGRVFLGRKRVTAPDAPVRAGDEVTVSPHVEDGAEPPAAIAHGDGWTAFDKPAGLPTIPDHAGASHALLALAARALSLPPERLHPTSRLDRDVSGVVVFATDPRAADRLKRARDEGTYARRYVGVASRAPEPAHGAWDVPIGRAKDPRHRIANGRDPADARTLFAVVARAEPRTEALLALAPVTGRTHQLRVHSSHAGAPLVGDRIYGGPARLTLATGKVVALDRVLLHCARVSVDGHAISAPIPSALRSLWLALGGADDAWDKAVSCALD